MYQLSFSDMVELVAIKCRVMEGLLEGDEITQDILDQLSELSDDVNQLIYSMKKIREDGPDA